MLWTFEAGCRRERPPVSLLCYCHNHTAVQRELNADRPVFVSESGTRRRRRHPQPLDTKAMFGGVSRVTSLFRANSLLWDTQMPLWPLTLKAFRCTCRGEK